MPADSFLSRWSKRKQESREAGAQPGTGNVPPPDVAASRSALVPPAAAVPAAAVESAATPTNAAASSPEAPGESATPTELPPVESLTPESDFRPFMRPDVDPAVRNQAMKSLFRDPHFNVMDMMDVYVDDYSKPDPIPEGMLRQMTQSRLLKLFDDLPEEAEGAAAAKDGSAINAGAATPVPAEPGEGRDAELSQKAPDTTICPTPANGNASELQQAKEN